MREGDYAVLIVAHLTEYRPAFKEKVSRSLEEGFEEDASNLGSMRHRCLARAHHDNHDNHPWRWRVIIRRQSGVSMLR